MVTNGLRQRHDNRGSGRLTLLSSHELGTIYRLFRATLKTALETLLKRCVAEISQTMELTQTPTRRRNNLVIQLISALRINFDVKIVGNLDEKYRTKIPLRKFLNLVKNDLIFDFYFYHHFFTYFTFARTPK